MPRQQAQYRVYRHACTCQPGRARGRGAGQSEGKEEEGGWGGEREQRRVNREYVESGRQDGGVPHFTYTQPHVHVNVCLNEDEIKGAYTLSEREHDGHSHSQMHKVHVY